MGATQYAQRLPKTSVLGRPSGLRVASAGVKWRVSAARVERVDTEVVEVAGFEAAVLEVDVEVGLAEVPGFALASWWGGSRC